MSKGKHITVAEYLTQQINICGKSQKQIADEIGYSKPNMITMLKQGKTRVPINKVPLLAKSLGVDAVHFLRLVQNEYMPETAAVIDEIIGDHMMSESEKRILGIIREASDGLDLAPNGEEEELELFALAQKWKAKAEAMADASARRVIAENPRFNQNNPNAKA